MRSVINKDYNYVIYKKNSLVLDNHKKLIKFSQKKRNFGETNALRFFFLDLYQEGFVSNHYYGFSVTSKRSRKVTLFRPSDRSFFKLSLELPSLLYLNTY